MLALERFCIAEKCRFIKFLVFMLGCPGPLVQGLILGVVKKKFYTEPWQLMKVCRWMGLFPLCTVTQERTRRLEAIDTRLTALFIVHRT